MLLQEHKGRQKEEKSVSCSTMNLKSIIVKLSRFMIIVPCLPCFLPLFPVWLRRLPPMISLDIYTLAIPSVLV